MPFWQKRKNGVNYTPDYIFNNIKDKNFLNSIHATYYEFDNIYKINNKRTNHQELYFLERDLVKTVSINKIYKGKLKIWYHKSVKDHICPTETVPYEIIDVAVKIIESSDAIENENNEPEMLYYLKDESGVIDLYGFHIDRDKCRCILVLEWCNGGDLFDYVKNNSSIINESDVKYIIKSLIKILLKCHILRICHSDIKLDNIMFNDEKDISHLKLIDFGASKFVDDDGKEIVYTFIGTSPHYTPPEVINEFHVKLNCEFLNNYKLKGENLFKIDSWQVGVVAFILLHGKYPFECPTKKDSIHKQKKMFKQFEYCKYPKFNSSSCSIDFIKKMMCFDPNKRLTLEEAINHPWLL